jgi:hypothetical protein
MTIDLLTDLYSMIDKMMMIVDDLFPESAATSTIITKIKSMAFMNDYTFIRFVWITNPDNTGRKFRPYRLKGASTTEVELNPTNGLPILSSDGYEIYNLYRQYSLDWTKDPLFKNVNMSV